MQLLLRILGTTALSIFSLLHARWTSPQVPLAIYKFVCGGDWLWNIFDVIIVALQPGPHWSRCTQQGGAHQISVEWGLPYTVHILYWLHIHILHYITKSYGIWNIYIYTYCNVHNHHTHTHIYIWIHNIAVPVPMSAASEWCDRASQSFSLSLMLSFKVSSRNWH